MKQKLSGKQKEWLVLLVTKAGWNTRDLVKVAGMGGYDQIRKLSAKKLVELGISEKKAERAMSLSEADWLEMKEKLARVKARVIVRGEEGYPNKLGELMQPPEILFARGRVENLDKTVAVVGTRKPSEYGRQMTRQIVAELVAQGITIISGLAYGVDGLAQESAVENGGTTIGVLGQGIDQVYPSKHLQLAHKILETGGGLVSEYPPGYPALRQNFAARNRIISGMSQGVVVVEGALKSGTMITAEFAQSQGRVLMAVPGMANSVNSQTPNELIRKGAVLVRNGTDVLEALGWKGGIKGRMEPKLSDAQKLIYDLLKSQGPMSLDEIVKLAGVDWERASEIIGGLELEEVVRRQREGKFEIGF